MTTMKTSQRLLIGLGLAGAVALAGAGLASERIATQTGRSCTSCHDKPGSKLLTDAGKYYEVMKTMDGFTEIKASFERCTVCHERRPGSKKLTKRGKQFAEIAQDMPGLNQWMREGHPMPAAK
jgi:hypothetical protein